MTLSVVGGLLYVQEHELLFGMPNNHSLYLADSIRVDPHCVLPDIPEPASGNPFPIIGIDL